MDFQTPKWVCDIMLNELSGNPVSILEPTPGMGNLVNAINIKYPFAHITAPTDYYELESSRYDAIVTNPPFTPMTVGYDILDSLLWQSDTIIALMPWLAIINSKKRSERYKSAGLKKVIHLPRNAFPGSRVQCCILVFNAGYSGDILFEFA